MSKSFTAGRITRIDDTTLRIFDPATETEITLRFTYQDLVRLHNLVHEQRSTIEGYRQLQRNCDTIRASLGMPPRNKVRADGC